MDDIIITLAAIRVLVALIASCGTLGCKTSIGLLKSATTDMSLASLGIDESGGWRMGVFDRLSTYAKKRGISTLDVIDVVSYFSGSDHIEYFRVHPSAGMGEFVGPSAGLVTHVLLPLDPDLIYRNAGYEISFDGRTILYNKGASGTPCYHLGVVVNIPLTKDQVEGILAEQRASEPFMSALSKIKGPIVPTEEYWQALSSTVKATARD